MPSDYNTSRPAVLHITSMVAITIALWTSASAYGQLANKAQTLAGHTSVFISVSTPKVAEAELGLTKQSLEKFLLRELGKAEIKVSNRFTNQTLVLEVTVDLHKVIEADDVNVYSFFTRFEAIQAARLATNDQAALTSTWQATQFGAVTRGEADRLRDSVTTNLKEFLAAWRKSHE